MALAVPTLALASDSTTSSDVNIKIIADKDCRSARFVETDVAPQIIAGRTLIPIRAVSESLNLNVDWDASTQTTIIYKDSVEAMRIPLGSNTVTVYGQPKTLDVPAQLISGRTMVPLRLVGETLGYQVKYMASDDGKAATIFVTPYTITQDMVSPFSILEPSNIHIKPGFVPFYNDDGSSILSITVTDVKAFNKDFEYGKTTLAQIESAYGKAYDIDYSKMANPKIYIYRKPFLPNENGGWVYTFELTDGLLTKIWITPGM